LTKLEVKVRKTIAQVDQSGRYTITAVSDPRSTKFGTAIVLTLTNAADQQRALFVPYSSEPSDSSNLGRLVLAFGPETSLWPKKKIDVTIGADKRRTVKPLGK
jgi:16S rRNA U1498 N3-methylase RsmE